MEEAAYLLPEMPVSGLDDYLAADGGRGLLEALEREPDAVVDEVTRSGLRGRGGAGFPTGVKWASVASAARDADCPVYLVCNAAEGEPGTYKDRTLMARNPYQMLEGLLVGLHALGADLGFVAIKRGYAHERERVLAALDEAREAGWQGADRVRVVSGPDEYLFGEEKALLEVIEGKLPMPRVLPPYQQGLFASMARPNPTAVNNVETLSHVPHILARGHDWFRRIGTQEAPGTMLFTVTGDAAAPGVYELPLGVPLRTLLCDIAGADDVKAVYSGTSNAVITPDLLDLPMDFDSFAEAGSGLGSGGFIVYDSSCCMVRVAATLSRFLHVESCGQCLACKLGAGEITELLERVDRGEGTAVDLQTILRRCATVTDLARCYLPVGEQLLVGSTLQAFTDEFNAHLGVACRSPREIPVPKITALDHDRGDVTLDSDYHRKRPDWSYADA